MNIKIFHGNSFQEGLDKVYAEFGERAKILHSREVVESRWFGLRQTRYVEITAAEPELKIEPEIETKTKTEIESESKSVRTDNQNFDRKSLRTQLTQNKSSYESDTDKYNLRNKFNRENSNALFFETNNHLKIKSNDQLLQKNEISGKVGVVPLGGWKRLELCDMNPTLLQRNLLMMFDEIVSFGGPIDFSFGRRVVVALVGATGVGKTSTIAKIAAFYKLRESRRVGLLTTDMFRIAAADQLQKYADMLEIQFETASSSDRVQAALKRLIGCDLVLVDTPGTNPLNEAKLRGINSVLNEANTDEIHLLLSATSSLPVLLETINRFSILHPTGLTLTKLDEAVGISDVYKMLKSNRLPLKFFTLGQNISEDIEVASSARLVSLYQQPNTK
ncbi:MAG: hypothetical protein LBC74_13685 [Planctomycetaceae bacterium]|jgi:flagellar biosynthesis protein FlhF|nr:hypothetical protein [Planctomycetaceae bacterium]